MANRWSQAKTLKFVHLYRDYENLWNVYHPGYRDREARVASMRAIVDEMKVANFTVKDVPKKIKALRSTYHLELQKVEKSRRSSEGTDFVYKPSLLWFDAMGYIMDSNHASNEESVYSNTETAVALVEQPREKESPQQQHRIPDARVFYYGDDAASSSSSTRPYVVRTSSTTTPHHQAMVRHAQQKRKHLVTTGDVVRELKELKERIGASSREDECDVMGRHIALQLRELPVPERVRANFEIQKILTEFRLRNIEEMNDTSQESS